MTPDEAKQLLNAAAGDEYPVCLPPGVLKHIAIADVPVDTSIEVGVLMDGGIHLEWEGYLRNDSGALVGEAEFWETRQQWYSPIGLEQYLDLVRRAVEVRARTHGDVSAPEYYDDGNYIQLRFTVRTDATNLGDAYHRVEKVCCQLRETAEHASSDIGKRISEVAARVSGWGTESLDALVDAVENAKSPDDKGRSLEELFSRLLESIPGFSVTGRIKTATEEIDISILNDSQDARFRRESAMLLGECKNWSGKCGKNEFVIFKEKLENRNRRCSLGFLLSWNGFAETVTKEMLRGSRDEYLIVPITGEHIRAAVRDKNFPDVLAGCWDAAVNL
jgi:hypothetical protein